MNNTLYSKMLDALSKMRNMSNALISLNQIKEADPSAHVDLGTMPIEHNNAWFEIEKSRLEIVDYNSKQNERVIELLEKIANLMEVKSE